MYICIILRSCAMASARNSPPQRPASMAASRLFSCSCFLFFLYFFVFRCYFFFVHIIRSVILFHDLCCLLSFSIFSFIALGIPYCFITYFSCLKNFVLFIISSCLLSGISYRFIIVAFFFMCWFIDVL